MHIQIIILIGTLLFFLIIGAPIGFSVIFASLATMLSAGLSLPMVVVKMTAGVESYILTAIPFFTLAGVIMREGGITSRIIDYCLLGVGHLKGALGHVNIISSMIFGGISGSSVADTASIGNVLIPEMIKQKYPRNFSAAVTSISSTIGIVIPPSIPMILYAIVSQVSIAKLFLAGAIPGLLIGVFQMVVNSIVSHKRDYPIARETRAKPIEMVKGLKHACLAVGMPIVIVCGITFGFVTATEAAVLAVVYAMVIGFFVYRELHWNKFPAMLKEAASATAIVMLIVIGASVMGWVLAYLQIPQFVSAKLLAASSNPIIVLLLINVILLFMGMISDVAPNILILTPIFLPVIIKLGIDPVHFGIIFILNQAIALVTPPVGSCLYICSNLGKVSVEDVFLSGLPFLGANLAVLLLVVFVPDICLWLPNLLMK